MFIGSNGGISIMDEDKNLRTLQSRRWRNERSHQNTEVIITSSPFLAYTFSILPMLTEIQVKITSSFSQKQDSTH
jgi:hypothetical protein